MKFGISVPQQLAGSRADVDALRDFCRRSEELGFDSLWTQDNVIVPRPTLDAQEVLMLAADCTQRIKVGCAVWMMTGRSPVHMAKSLATIDQLSGGRLQAGVGQGANAAQDAAYGVDPTTRAARFEESVRIMKALWSEPKVTFEGRFWQLRDTPLLPKPVQQPLPLWFGGNAPHALRRAARLGDAWVGAGSSTTAQFAQQAALLRDHLRAEGRDPSGYPISKRIYVVIDDDRESARTAVIERGNLPGKPELHTEWTAWGTPGDVLDEMHRVADVGVDMIMLTPLFDHREHLERIAAEILPKF